MADSQSLFDALAGAAGAPVNRAGINAGIANSQAINGLRSAQTEEAMQNASKAQQEQAARAGLEDAYTSQFNGDRVKGKAAATMAIAQNGNVEAAARAMNELQQNNFRQTLSDPTQQNLPSQTLAQQGVKGEVAPPIAVHPEYAQLPGQAPLQVRETPQGTADVTLKNAQASAAGANANLHNSQASSAQDPNAVAFGAYKLFKTGQMPNLGMGNGPVKMQMLSAAADLARREAGGEDVTNPGFESALQHGQDFTAGGRADNSFAGGPLGNQTRFLNNSVGHLSVMDGLVTALQNGDVQAFNKASTAWKKQFGSDAPTNLQAASEVIAPEIAKQMAGTSAGSKDERADLQHTLAGLQNSPDQSHGAIQTMRALLGRQGADLAFQYHGALGRNDFVKRYVQPDVAQYLDLHDGTVPAPAGGAGAAPAAPATAAGPTPVSLDDYLKSHGH